MKDTENSMARLVIGAKEKDSLRKELEAATGRPPSEEELQATWEQFTRPEGPGFKAAPEKHIEHIIDMLPGLTRLYWHRSWSLLRFEELRLTTSDNPVALVGTAETRFYGVGVGIAEHTILPLDRQAALSMNQQIEEDIEFPLDKALSFAVYIKQYVAKAAYRALYHHPDDQPLEGLQLPEAISPRVTTSNMDHLISETGHRPSPQVEGDFDAE